MITAVYNEQEQKITITTAAAASDGGLYDRRDTGSVWSQDTVCDPVLQTEIMRQEWHEDEQIMTAFPS